jgi:hypothetical protein
LLNNLNVLRREERHLMQISLHKYLVTSANKYIGLTMEEMSNENNNVVVLAEKILC